MLLAAYDLQLAIGEAPGLGPYGEKPFGYESVAVDVSLHVAAVDGGGTVLWTRSFTGGQLVYTGLTLAVVKDLPILAGSLDALPGPATDVAVAVYNRTPTADNGQDDFVDVVTIDGADGDETATLHLDIDNTEAPVRPGPDLDGDGLDDLVIRLRPAAGETPVEVDTLLAVRGSDGSELWRSTAATLRRFTAVSPLGDATGDGITDLAVSEPGLRQPNAVPRRVVLLDGASGGTVFEEVADTARGLGDIDGDQLADVLLSSAFYTSRSVEVVHTAIDASGGLIYERSFLVQNESASNRQAQLVAFPGDVDGDGTVDFGHRLRVSTSSSPFVTATDVRLLSGRTGETIRTGEPLGNALGVSLDGDGDDLSVVTSFGASVVDVAAVDGRTGEPLFTTRLRPRGDVTRYTQVEAADVTGDGSPDLVVNTQGEGLADEVGEGVVFSAGFVDDGYVLDGRTGAIVWATDPPRVPPEPDLRGKVSADSSFTWEGTAATGLNGQVPFVSREGCSGDDPMTRCEQVLVEFANPPDGGAESATRTARVTLSQFEPVPEPVTDIDLYVHESDELGTVGPLVGYSARFGPPLDPSGEEVAFEVTTTLEEPSTFYIVSIVYFRTVETGYRGTAELT